MDRYQAYDAMRDGHYITSNKYHKGGYCYQDKSTMLMMYQSPDYSRPPERINGAMDELYEPFKIMRQNTNGPDKTTKLKTWKIG